MEGKFTSEGLQAIDGDDDMLTAMARELVENKGIGESAPIPSGESVQQLRPSTPAAARARTREIHRSSKKPRDVPTMPSLSTEPIPDAVPAGAARASRGYSRQDASVRATVAILTGPAKRGILVGVNRDLPSNKSA